MTADDTRRPVGLGCMRLSSPSVNEPRAIAALHAALDAGVTLLDTADVYAPTDGDLGHNERLITRALAAWSGDRARVQVASKGGLTRPGGRRWIPDGRARHLVAAAEASRAALGVDAIDLYQLHAVDPRTPLATSVRALAELRAAGVVRAIGLCNVTLGQLRDASRVAEIDAVQVALHLGDDQAIHAGLVEHCRERGIALLCHTPLGGPTGWPRRARTPALRAVAGRRGVTPAEIALAWLCDLGPHVTPLPGATRPETAASAAAGQRLVLDDDDRRALDEIAPAGRIARTPRASRRPGSAAADVVLVMGSPAAGKSTWVRDLVAAGHQRLNRDLTGGSLTALAGALERGLAGGGRRFVLDNTYPSRAARSRVIEAAWRHRAEVRCVWLDTSLEDAQVNAVFRMLDAHGRLLDPHELSGPKKADPVAIPPRALFDYRRALEPPDADEGFAAIDVVSFARAAGPGRTRRALLIDLEHLPADPAPLRRWRESGWLILCTSWQPGVASGATSAAEVDRRLTELRDGLGLDDAVYCGHGPGPPICWCRKPLPGLAALLIHRHGLDPPRCHLVGQGAPDRGLAARLGFGWIEAGAPGALDAVDLR